MIGLDDKKCHLDMLWSFRKFPGVRQPYSQYSKTSEETDQPASLELWMDVTSTLCGCVNNPQNGENDCNKA